MKNSEQVREFIKQYKNVCGVYAIVCGDKRYVGSSVDISNRIKTHFYKLNQFNHCNKNLQRDFDLYPDKFYCILLEECLEQDLLTKEFSYFGEYNIQKKIKLISVDKINSNIFWSKVNKTQYCWEWNDKIDKDGYGKYRGYKANRIAYYLTNPDISQNQIIRHKCNNKICCNPDHLMIGSFSDNAKDCNLAGLIFANLVRNIVKQNPNLKGNEIKNLIEEYYSIKLTNFYNIIHNKIYTDQNWNFHSFKNEGEDCHLSKINWNIVNDIRSNYNGSFSETKKYIFNKYHIDLDLSQIINIIKNKHWKDNNYIFNQKSILYNKPWIKDDDLFLINNFKTIKYKDLAIRLDRTLKSVKHRIKKLNLSKGDK